MNDEKLAAAVLMVGFPGQSAPTGTRDLMRRGVRNFAFFARNLGSPSEIQKLTSELRAAAGGNVLLAIDHEGGAVHRFGEAITQWPSPMAQAATWDVRLIEHASSLAAGELRALGINLNFAPVVDVLSDYRNPVLGTRVFSDDPAYVGECAAAFIRGHQQAGVGATAKHFPGHGATPTDSHLDLPIVSRSLDELNAADLVPFRAAIAAGVDCLMISHVWYQALDERETPATLSPGVVDLARRDLQFDGVIVTDCLEMNAIQGRMQTGAAAVQALQAGSDLVLVSHTAERQLQALHAIAAALDDGRLDRSRIMRSVERLDGLQKRLQPGGAFPTDAPAVAKDVARRAVTVVRGQGLPWDACSQRRICVINCAVGAASLAESVGKSSLAQQVQARGVNVTEVLVSGIGDVAAAVVAMREHDAVLIASSFALLEQWQGDLVRQSLGTGKPVAVLAVRDPFDLLAFPEAPTYLACYGLDPLSTEAAVAVLFGEQAAQGRLPVELPGLYPRGFGIQLSI